MRLQSRTYVSTSEIYGSQDSILSVSKQIVVEGDHGSVTFDERIRSGHPRWNDQFPVNLVSVSGFWVTFEVQTPSKTGIFSEPIA